ncbi:hypothetical protein L2E82_13978 [Cichorium intybus]|uniref:Uncharacterized protein n=1 Tax=Cichorium intybus TaxID=13427 RepID=A0ACB9EYT3_CICIN|nr:hypothetical protein L2E82_13978 [Cichorium intybus]
MAPGSSSSFKGADHTELMMNSQQESNLVLPTSLVPVQHHHATEPGSSRKFFNFFIVLPPYTLALLTTKDVVPKKVYLCPEPTCINHNRSHALGDFGGLKKHYLRKHVTEKKHKCDSCSKAYAVESDLRAHLRNCSKRKYICECGARFSRYGLINFHVYTLYAFHGIDFAI